MPETLAAPTSPPPRSPPRGPTLFDRSASQLHRTMSLPRACTPSPALGAASGSSVLRQQDEQQKHKEELQRKVREVEVRAMQEVVELRKSLAAAHLDAQEQRRLYASLRDKQVHDERNVRTPAAQEAAVCSAREAAERASEAALAAQLEQQLAAREDRKSVV